MDVEIIKYITPLNNEIIESLLFLGEENCFKFRVDEFTKPGSTIFIAWSKGKAVASRRFLKSTFINKVSKKTIMGLQCCETITDDKYRGRGLFGKIWERALKECKSDVDLFYNFPNDVSFKPYIKSGFKLLDYMIVFYNVQNIAVADTYRDFFFDENNMINNTEGDYSSVKLTNGIHKFFPIQVLKGNKLISTNVPKYHFFGCNLNALRKVHQLNFVKAPLFTLRPITFFQVNDDIDVNNLYLTPGSYDTTQK